MRLTYRRPCYCGWRLGAVSGQWSMACPPRTPSKEAPNGSNRPPPRPTTHPQPSPVVLPLEQLWACIAPSRQQEVLQRLTEMLAQRLAQPNDGEASDE
jgi:hypothetical protein